MPQCLETGIDLWQVASRKSVFTDRTRELARRAAGNAGDFYGRSIHFPLTVHLTTPLVTQLRSRITGDLL